MSALFATSSCGLSSRPPPKLGEFLVDGAVVLDRVAAGVRREVDEVHEQLRARQVAQEAGAEPGAVRSPGDQARDVGDDEALALLEAHDAQVRRERREGVVGDLRLGRGDRRDQRALAGVREADDADVREQFELEDEFELLPFLPRLRLARRLVGRGDEVGVAEAAAAALRDDHPLAGRRRGRRPPRRWP